MNDLKKILTDTIASIQDVELRKKVKITIDKFETKLIQEANDLIRSRVDYAESIIRQNLSIDKNCLEKRISELNKEYEVRLEDYNILAEKIEELNQKKKELEQEINTPKAKAGEVFRFYSILKNEALLSKNDLVKVQLLKNAAWITNTLAGVEGLCDIKLGIDKAE